MRTLERKGHKDIDQRERFAAALTLARSSLGAIGGYLSRCSSAV